MKGEYQDSLYKGAQRKWPIAFFAINCRPTLNRLLQNSELLTINRQYLSHMCTSVNPNTNQLEFIARVDGLLISCINF